MTSSSLPPQDPLTAGYTAPAEEAAPAAAAPTAPVAWRENPPTSQWSGSGLPGKLRFKKMVRLPRFGASQDFFGWYIRIIVVEPSRRKNY